MTSEIRITATCSHCKTRIPLAVEGLRSDITAVIKCYACGAMVEVHGRDYSEGLKRANNRKPDQSSEALPW